MWRFSELQWHRIVQLKLDQYDGKTIGGVAITKSGMLGGAHLVGLDRLRTFLRSNSQIVPVDGNGTKITGIHPTARFVRRSLQIGPFKSGPSDRGSCTSHVPKCAPSTAAASSLALSPWLRNRVSEKKPWMVPG